MVGYVWINALRSISTVDHSASKTRVNALKLTHPTKIARPQFSANTNR